MIRYAVRLIEDLTDPSSERITVGYIADSGDGFVVGPVSGLRLEPMTQKMLELALHRAAEAHDADEAARMLQRLFGFQTSFFVERAETGKNVVRIKSSQEDT